MKKLYREWSPRKNARGKAMLEDSAIEFLVKTQYNPGYAGVYSFDEEVAEAVKANRSIRGLNQYAAYADRLTIDIDGTELHPADTTELETKLQDMGVGYEKWFSGSKGYHIILKHELMGSKDLPWSHRKYVEDVLKIECDTSLYQHGRIISLPGRVHEKTKKKKVCLYKKPGKEIELELQTKPEVEFKFSDLGVGELERALMNLQMLAAAPPTPGQRHTSIWGTATDLARAGIDYQTTLNMMLAINSLWVHKKQPEEVILAVQQAYRQLSSMPLSEL